MSEELRGCPFCGKPPRLNHRASDNTGTGELWTIACFCGGYSARTHQMGATKEAVIAAWNLRADSRPAPTLSDAVCDRFIEHQPAFAGDHELWWFSVPMRDDKGIFLHRTFRCTLAEAREAVRGALMPNTETVGAKEGEGEE
jgi:Lar family restriction alleviation protein